MRPDEIEDLRSILQAGDLTTEHRVRLLVALDMLLVAAALVNEREAERDALQEWTADARILLSGILSGRTYPTGTVIRAFLNRPLPGAVKEGDSV